MATDSTVSLGLACPRTEPCEFGLLDALWVVRDCYILEPKLQAGQLVCVTPTIDGPRTGHQVMKDHTFIPVCRCLCAVFLPSFAVAPLLRTGVRRYIYDDLHGMLNMVLFLGFPRCMAPFDSLEGQLVPSR